MNLLVIGLIVFIGVHSVRIAAPAWREAAIARIGDKPWKGIYALLSLAGLALIVWGYGQARAEPVVLYVPPYWLRHVALLLLLPVFPLFAVASRPGRIRSMVKHPMFLGTKLWAFAHLLANGMLADVLLFGAFLAWAIVARISAKRRNEDPEPVTAFAPGEIPAVIVGLALYVLFVWKAHLWLFGVAPIPA